METKICSKCKKELPATSEYYHKKRATCKDCLKLYYREYHKKNRQKRIERMKDYRQENKEEILKKQKEWYIRNKEHVLTHVSKYRENNREKVLLSKKKYRLNNKEKVKKQLRNAYLKNRDEHIQKCKLRRIKIKTLPANYSPKQWSICKRFFDYKCAYCGEKKELTQEHFIPVNKNGEYTINNIIPACRYCNGSKQDRDFFDWYPKQEFYSKQRERKILKYLNYKSEDMQQLALL